MDDLQEYKQYAEDCISGKQVCCKYIKLAAQRYLDFFSNSDYEFRKDKVDKMVKFIENITLFEGKFYGQKLKLLPFQKFMIYGGYGFYYRGTDQRVVKHIILDIGRKQAKSTLCAAIALYHLIGENEYSAEIDIAANSKEQARILFRMSCELSKLMDMSGKHINRTINRVRFPRLNSFIQCLAADTTKLDGFGASLFIEDEFHAAADTKLYDVLASSQGSRNNPMSIIATSAGYNLAGPYYSEIRKSAIDMLEGLIKNDSLFVLIYTLDEGDDFRDKNNWIKSMPGLGVMVPENYIEDRILNIKTQPSTETDVITKNFNVWCQTEETWLEDDYIVNSFEKVDINDYQGEECLVGIDLSATRDLTSVSVMFPPNKSRQKNKDKFVFKTWCFLPEESIDKSPNRSFFTRAKNCKHLLVTNGNVVDYDYILNLLLQINEVCPINGIYYDTFNATQFAIDCEEAGLPMTPFAQKLGNFNRPTKEFERLLLTDQIVMDGNVIVRWNFQNVVLKRDKINDNIKPIKASDNQKIDGVISMLECLGGFLLDPRYVYYIKQ